MGSYARVIEIGITLAQLASRMASAIRLGADGKEDPFGKVRGLIKDMIAQLEGDAKQDASHKAYIDPGLRQQE